MLALFSRSEIAAQYRIAGLQLVNVGDALDDLPMRRLGANVWPLNTVQFSNHTQYGKWTGCVMPPSHLNAQDMLALFSRSEIAAQYRIAGLQLVNVGDALDDV
jgi:hypothetical protein